MKNEILHTIALTQLDGIGYFNAKKIIDHFGSSTAFFENPSEAINVNRITDNILNKSNLTKAIERAKRELDFTDKNNIIPILISNSAYPQALKECPDAPIILFGKGNFKALFESIEAEQERRGTL